MIALLDTSEDLKVAEIELGCPIRQLLTPLTRFNLQYPDEPFAVDNGAYAKFKADAFRSLLEREQERKKQCLFVAVPDVVGNARRTLEVFEHWQHSLYGWPLALVVQDGAENFPVPWSEIKAIFIGGSTSWKLSGHVKDIIKAAQACEKWVHAGRVNTPARYEYFESLGVDSIDGTGLSRFSWMREKIHAQMQQPNLLTELSREAGR
jgi:hypothetical protein